MFSFGSSSKRGGGSSNKSEDTTAKTSNNNVLSKKSSFLSASSAGASAQSSGNGSATGNTSHQTNNIQSTFRKKPIPVGQKGIELQAHINSTLGNNGSLRDAVKLPKGEDELEDSIQNPLNTRRHDARRFQCPGRLSTSGVLAVV